MKGKVVHTRVSEELYEKIKQKSKAHRVTVSNLIRNLVEDAIDISGDVVSLVDQRIKEYLDKDTEIIGFQSFVLSKDTKCEVTGVDLKKGKRAYLAILASSHNKIVVSPKFREEYLKKENEQYA